MMVEYNYNNMEQNRQDYLANLAEIVTEEELTPSMATQLMFAEIASWLMVISQLMEIEADKE